MDASNYVDYRALNQVTIRNQYPLPLIPELTDQVRTVQIYTKLDFRDVYNPIHVRAGEEWKIAFQACSGNFEYLEMPFCLTKVPATFQYFIVFWYILTNMW